MDRSVGSPRTRSVVEILGPGFSVFGLPRRRLLFYHPPQPSTNSYSYFLFAVRLTGRSKADDGSATYNGCFILKKEGSAYSACCHAKEGAYFHLL